MTSPCIGVAGYMGAGKSTCSRFLSEYGFRVVDGDREAKAMMVDTVPIHHRLSAVFGPAVLENDTINFKILGSIVFGDSRKLGQLNAIVHPLLLDRLHNMIFNENGETAMAVDAALIPLWNIDDWFDLRIWIHAPRKVRLHRLAEKLPGLSEEEISGRMEMQECLFGPPSNDRWIHIENAGDRTALKNQVLAVIGR